MISWATLHAVEHGNQLASAQGHLGAEGAVGHAAEQAHAGCHQDIILGPMVGDVGKGPFQAGIHHPEGEDFFIAAEAAPDLQEAGRRWPGTVQELPLDWVTSPTSGVRDFQFRFNS